jgi:VWFA-related protein
MSAPLTSTYGNRNPVLSALLFAVSVSAFALGVFPGRGAAQETAEMTSKEQPAVFRSSTNLVLVPVVVRDSKGRAVTTLRKEDFRLMDAGKVQEITRFTIETGAASPGATAGTATPASAPVAQEQPRSIFEEAPVTGLAERFIVYLFDDLHISTQDFLMSRQAAERHLAADFGPSDRAAILTTSGQFSLAFTGDRPALLKALGSIVPKPVERAADCDETSYYIADRYRNMHDTEADHLLTLQVQECHPDYDEPAIKVEKDAMTLRALSQGEYNSRLAMAGVGNAIRLLGTVPGKRALVLVSPGFIARQLTVEKTDLMDRALRAAIAVNTVDGRGLATYAPMAEDRGQIGGPLAQSLRFSMDRGEKSEQGDVLAEIAYGTGGVWVHDTNDLVGGFRAAASPPECVYVLAFIPQNLKYDGRFHALKVSINGGYSIQSRRGYYAPTKLMDAEEQAREEIREAVFSREEVRDIPLELRTQFFKPTDISATISVTAQLDAEQLHFRKSQGRNSDSLKVVTVVFDRNGKWVSGNEKTLQLNLKDATLSTRFASGLSLRTSFNVTPGLYQIRVVVRDSEGQMMAARNAAVEIP